MASAGCSRGESQSQSQSGGSWAVAAAEQSSWGCKWLSLAAKERVLSWWTNLGQVSENGGNAIVPAVALVVGAFTRTFHKP